MLIDVVSSWTWSFKVTTINSFYWVSFYFIQQMPLFLNLTLCKGGGFTVAASDPSYIMFAKYKSDPTQTLCKRVLRCASVERNYDIAVSWYETTDQIDYDRKAILWPYIWMDIALNTIMYSFSPTIFWTQTKFQNWQNVWPWACIIYFQSSIKAHPSHIVDACSA